MGKTPTPDATIITEERFPLRTLTRDLRCDLTLDEVRAKGEKLARQQAELDLAKAEHKHQKSLMADAEKELGTDISSTAYDVRTRSEERPVTCTWYADYARDRAILVRDDTGVELERRTLTPDERQMELGVGPTDSTGEARAKSL